MTVIEHYEIQAYAFRRMTGYTAPGKDAGMAGSASSFEERCGAWDVWHKAHGNCIRAMLDGFIAIMEDGSAATGGQP